MSRFLVSFLEGYGSIIGLFILPEQDDAENLRGDWMRVGSYLRHSIETIEEEVQKGVRESTGEDGEERAK